MRVDSSNFQALNRARNSTPVLVVELSLNSTNTELAYLTSHQVDDLPTGAGITHFQSCLISCSSTSQKLKVSDFSSTIGSVSAKVSDKGSLTGYLRARFGEGKTTSQNRFRMYAGFDGIAFADFSLVQTQITRTIAYDDGAIDFSCRDVQHDTRKKLFDPAVTLMTANLTATATAVSVQNTSGFELVWHGPSYSDAPNLDAGYIIVRKDSAYEIMRWSAKAATGFTIAERGAFGTVPQAWEALDQDGESNELEVEEFIYLELPVVKLAYAVLTGNLYGDTGKSLPDHWQLGISEQWVSTAQFTNIGPDIWDVNDDTKGKVCLFLGVKDEGGRDFINQQLMPLIGCFMPISASGELGLRRIVSVLSTSPYSALLTKANVKKVSPIKYAQDEIQNQMQVDWSYDFVKGGFRRADLFRDSTSAIDNGYGWRDEKTLKLKGMHGNRHSRDFMRGVFMSFRDRYGREPIYCKVDLIPGLNVLEVADTVRLNLEDWADYTDTGDLNRTFEVQGVTVDWLNGNVTADLFGSTNAASALADDGDGYAAGYAIDDALLTSEGTNIEAAFSGNVSRSGDLVTLNSSITFAGNSALTEADGTPNPACILYCDGDLLIPNGVSLNFTKNMILICTGFLTVNGEVSSVGGGPDGMDYRRTYLNQALYGIGTWPTAIIATGYDDVNASYPAPTPGFMHSTMRGQGGFSLNDGHQFHTYTVEVGAGVGSVFSEPETAYAAVPEIALSVSDLSGLPSNLQGGAGPAGGHVFTRIPSTFDLQQQAAGTSGGNGGGGLATITRGLSFGTAGKIDLSGGAAVAGAGSYLVTGETFRAGVGCGGSPGAWLCLIDGGDSTPPIVDSTKLFSLYGDGPSEGDQLVYWLDNGTYTGSPLYMGSWDIGSESIPGDNHASAFESTSQTVAGVNLFSAYHRVQFLLPETGAPGEETPADTVAPDVTAITLTENTNSPQSPAGNLSTVDVLVTPPASTAYAYSWIYVRKQGATAWNKLEFAAENETTFTEISNGSTWEVQARSVSKSGVENASGPVDTVTLTNKAASATYALEIGYDENDETLLRIVNTSTSAVIGSVSGSGGIAGKVVAGTGSTGYSNLSDKPTALSGINSGEGTKLSGIEANADKTQTALDAEVTTTGGVVLSTSGAVRTAGKTAIDDGNAGVILGDVAGEKVFYVGDGGDKAISFNGTDLVLGAQTRLIGVPSAAASKVSFKAYPRDLASEIYGASSFSATDEYASLTLSSAGPEAVFANWNKTTLGNWGSDYRLDDPGDDQYFDIEFTAGIALGGSSGHAWTYAVGIGSAGENILTGAVLCDGIGFLYDNTTATWYAYAQDGADSAWSSAKTHDITASVPSGTNRFRIVYTGASAAGGTDKVLVYVNQALVHTFTSVGAIEWVGHYAFANMASYNGFASGPDVARLGQVRVITANPADMNQ